MRENPSERSWLPIVKTIRDKNKKMTIREFLESKQIRPGELDQNFKTIKVLELDAYRHEGCFNCPDKANQKRLETDSWCGCQYCWSCGSINMIFFSDRMSGATTDTVIVYKDK